MTTIKGGFEGARVVAFESRLALVMAESLKKHGADPLVAPSMKEIPLENHPEVLSFSKQLSAGNVHILISMTGVGTKLLIEILTHRLGQDKTVQELSRLCIVARGPKSVKVLREAGIPITITVPEPNTWQEIIEELDWNKSGVELKEKTVAIQEYGIANEELMAALKTRGANIIQIPVYRWGLPDDAGPLEQAIREIVDGKVKIVLFTSAHQVRNLFRLASERGMETPLRKALAQVVVCSIGPTCSDAIMDNEIAVDFVPSHPKLGQLVSEAAKNSSQLIQEKTTVRKPSIELSLREIPRAEKALRKDAVFLKACRREPTPFTPVWFMRQAGRYMKEYRRIRDRVPFIELCKNTELCAEITISAAEKLKVDAAIIFSDLLLIVEPLGMNLKYAKSEGPVISDSLESAADIDRLREIDPAQALSFVMDSIRLTRSSLSSQMPLIGFGPAPFTLASYMIEGGGSRHFTKTKAWMHSDPGAWHALMDKLDRVLVKYLNAQIDAGADALQLFDSWIGCLGPQDYRDFVYRHTQKVIAGIKNRVPVIHFGTGNAAFFKDFSDAGGDVIGVDYRMELGEAWKTAGYTKAVQGNLDPALLFSPRGEICAQAKRILDQANRRPGHIFNLGHGVLPHTPEDHVLALVDFVHEISQKQNRLNE